MYTLEEVGKPKKNRAAVELGRLRAKKLSPERRTEIATTAGKKRASVLSARDLSDIGRRGGLAGGKARAAKLTKKQRSTIARKAAIARWAKKKQA